MLDAARLRGQRLERHQGRRGLPAAVMDARQAAPRSGIPRRAGDGALERRLGASHVTGEEPGESLAAPRLRRPAAQP